jgi:hypothetical protein
MAHTRKDTFTKTRDRAKHLRPEGKRAQNKAERRHAKHNLSEF